MLQQCRVFKLEVFLWWLKLESDMADSSGGIGIIGVIVGVAIVLLVGFFLLNGNMGNSKSVDINIKPPVTSSK